MASFVSSVIDWLSAHAHIAYLAVFLLALSESIPMIGVIVPGIVQIIPTPARARSVAMTETSSRKSAIEEGAYNALKG